MAISCWIGWHEKITIKTVSFLEYMALAMGEHIKDVSTKDLLILMEQLYKVLAPTQVSDNLLYIERSHIKFNDNKLDVLFDGNEAMADHVKTLKEIFDGYYQTIDRLEEIEKLWGRNQREYNEARDEKDMLHSRRDRYKDYLYHATLGFKIMFCTKCRKTFDIRNELGTFLPQLVASLRTIQMNETSGTFLLPSKGEE